MASWLQIAWHPGREKHWNAAHRFKGTQSGALLVVSPPGSPSSRGPQRIPRRPGPVIGAPQEFHFIKYTREERARVGKDEATRTQLLASVTVPPKAGAAVGPASETPHLTRRRQHPGHPPAPQAPCLPWATAELPHLYLWRPWERGRSWISVPREDMYLFVPVAVGSS